MQIQELFIIYFIRIHYRYIQIDSSCNIFKGGRIYINNEGVTSMKLPF